MSKLKLPANVTRAFHKTKFQLKKHSPEILVVAGVAGVVTSAVMACKATLKVNDILEETKETVDRIHHGVENKSITKDGQVYTEELAKKDLTLVYAQTGLKFVKLYGPALLVGATSIGCIFAGNKILHKRNVALAAAYTAVDTSFKDYRNRVIERFGKELDRELKYNIRTEEIEETVVNEDGTESTVKKNVEVADFDPNDYSIYSRVFMEGNKGWDKDPAYSLMFLKSLQGQFNNKLQSEGVVYLNEVYEALGYQKTTYGQVVGWIYDEKNPVGDNYIDFGIYNVRNRKACDFVNGDERNIILDFNVDGNVYDLLS